MFLVPAEAAYTWCIIFLNLAGLI